MPFVQIWIPTIDLDQFDKDVIMNGGLFCDKHMNGASKLISQQFPAVHGMQNTLLSQMHTAQKVCYTTLYIIAIYLNIRSNISCLRIEHYNQMLILQYSQSRVVCGILANL